MMHRLLSTYRIFISKTRSKRSVQWLSPLSRSLTVFKQKLPTSLMLSYLPSTEVDARKDEPAEDFFNRLWSSPYFASMRAMLEMSVVRAILALAWFAFLSPLLIAVVIDAWVVRRLKYESFAVNHPTLYQAALSAPSVLLVCAFAVMLMPWFIPAWIAALFYAAFLVSIHLIVSNFHRFG